jgi:diguanylate cyclase (GGDEF)-like protein/PAS domain S-box-containing protein
VIVPSPFRVLLLEDDRFAQEMIRRELGKGVADLHFRCVDNEEAFEAAVREPGLHAILSDFKLPSFDGMAALRLARRLQPRVPFIVVTGSIDEETAAECIKAGAADYVLKDRLQRLWPALRGALDKRHVQEERERALAALEESEQRYSLAVHGANDGIWDWDLKQRRAYFSARWKSLVGATADELRDDPREWLDRIHPDDQPAFREAFDRHLSGEHAHFECEHRVRQPNGSYLWVLGRGSALRDANGEAYRIAGSLTDISRRKEAEAQLIHDALHDSLTGLANRALFLDRLRMAMARSLRRGDHHFAVFFVDLDQFKVVNDSLGHGVGDELLVLLAHRLFCSLRPGDTVARLGGDEFAVLVEDVASPADAIGVARRALDAFGPSFHPHGHELFSSASIGIVLGARSYAEPEEYLRDADTAMYRAKARGRGQFEIFDSSMHALASSRLALETDIRRALDRGEFRVFYQPLVDLEHGRSVGWEALVRWEHPQRGWLMPQTFIGVAEEMGAIVPLGEFVLREACRSLGSWRRQYAIPSNLSMSVNLSVRQFTQGDMTVTVGDALRAADLPAGNLRLEITESALMDDPRDATARLARLRGLGVHLDIDDFGTGYSSLSQLSRFPIDALKIDRSFVSGMEGDQEAHEIVRAIVTLADTLGLEAVAEGMETDGQRQSLRALGCHVGQGFLFGRPAPYADVSAGLARAAHA